jgi:2-oxoisovalerate dehydrogenase E1 component alpha subunit
MRPEDVLLPSYRDNAALLWRGVTMEDILLFWGGDERFLRADRSFRPFRAFS